MADIIVSEEEAIKQLLGEELESRVRTILREFGFSAQQANKDKSSKNWLPIEEAKKIVPIKSKKKWKELRDQAQVDFAKVGKGFIYEIESLRNYILTKSTITKNKNHERNRK